MILKTVCPTLTSKISIAGRSPELRACLQNPTSVMISGMDIIAHYWRYIILTRFFTGITALRQLISRAELSDHAYGSREKKRYSLIKITRSAQNDWLQTLDFAYYPNLRGPYNYTTTGVNADGTLANPKSRWGANINVEENGKRDPIPYIQPPGINRQVDWSNNNYNVRLNEQALSLDAFKSA
ncbi:hypothetical protein FQR65_LT16512 [Abscondita terminalis]|nr:hypothetical protein FQR65_LT16512 [Abscondita terminalis]